MAAKKKSTKEERIKPKVKGEKPEKKEYKFPAELGKCIELLARLEKEEQEITAKLKPIYDHNKALRDYLLSTFQKKELDGMRAHGLLISLSTSALPSLKDWDAFFAFAKKKGNEDLLQRSINTPAWRERLEARKNVPGVEAYDRVSLSVRTDKKAA